MMASPASSRPDLCLLAKLQAGGQTARFPLLPYQPAGPTSCCALSLDCFGLPAPRAATTATAPHREATGRAQVEEEARETRGD